MLPPEADVIRGDFPHVSFTSIDGKQFGMHVDRILHYETYEDRQSGVLDHSRTFVNFLNPNSGDKAFIHAVVNMPFERFRDEIIQPAYERNT